jgi:hypothetical protein
MQKKHTVIVLIFIMISTIFPNAFAQPDVSIVLGKTTYSYCEKLFYTIEVSEVTGDPAIIHIRDETGKGSSAIPIQISNLQNPVPSLIPFESEVFPLGTYYIDVEYSGAKNTVEFELLDLGNICIPSWIKQLTYYWVTEQISDVSFSDGIEFLIEKEIIKIPETKRNTGEIETEIPRWVKVNAGWWIEERISDNDFAQALQFLIKVGIIII